MRARILVTVAAVLGISAAVAVAMGRSIQSAPQAYAGGVILALAVGLGVFLIVTSSQMTVLEQLKVGLQRFTAKDFHARLPFTRHTPTQGLVAHFNALGELLCAEKVDSDQREHLLKTIIDSAQASPFA